MLEKHIDGGQSDPHFPGTEQDFNRCIYFEALDLLVNEITLRATRSIFVHAPGILNFHGANHKIDSSNYKALFL